MDKVWWYVISQPDHIIAIIEPDALLVHLESIDAQDDRVLSSA